MRGGLRLRIAVAFAITCIAVVSALGLALYAASEELEEELVNQIVSEEVEHLIERHRADPGYQPVSGINLQYYILRTPGDSARLPEAVKGLPPGNHEVGRGLEERHVAVREAGGVRFLAVYDSGPHEVREEQFKQLLLLVLGTICVAAFVLGYWLAGMLTHQLTDLAQRVSRLASDSSAATLAHPEQDGEVRALAVALDDYQQRMNRMIRREQEFTANASHELRTPLTGIKTSCELLAGEAGLTEKGRERLTAIGRATDRMAGQLQLLLYLARERAATKREPVALAECVGDAAEPFRSALAERGVAFEEDVPRDAMVELDREALHLVLTNLIRNAVQNTHRGFVRVSYGAGKLTVSDSGNGIAPDRLPRVFERFYRGNENAEGHGLGLAIVKSICDRAGWTIDTESTPAAGSTFCIRFG